jgi:hypothetical protein
LPDFAKRAVPSQAGAERLLVIADTRYGESLLFAQALARNGATVLPARGDMAGLWSDDLQPRLAQHWWGVAGLTLDADRFVLERLAWSSGIVARYAGSHDWRGLNPSRHRLRGTIALEQIAASLVAGDGPWAARLGDALGSVRPSLLGSIVEERRLALDISATAASPKFLVSWLFSKAT